MQKTALVIGSVLGFMTVALGAFGAHALDTRLSVAAQDWWQTAVAYQGLHALTLIGLAAIARDHADPWLGRALWAFVVGVLLFSGSLYLLALTDWRALGMVTPIGGLGLLAGWAMLVLSATRIKQ